MSHHLLDWERSTAQRPVEPVYPKDSIEYKHQAMEDAARSPQRRKRARVSRDSSVGGRRRGVFRAQELDAALMAEVYNEWNGGKDIFSIVLSFL